MPLWCEGASFFVWVQSSMRIAFLSILLACVGCAHTSALEKRCRPLVGEILAVQAERDRLSGQMGMATQAFEAGTITRQEHESEFQTWLASERRLHQHVTSLYDHAYATGCL